MFKLCQKCLNWAGEMLKLVRRSVRIGPEKCSNWARELIELGQRSVQIGPEKCSTLVWKRQKKAKCHPKDIASTSEAGHVQLKGLIRPVRSPQGPSGSKNATRYKFGKVSLGLRGQGRPGGPGRDKQTMGSIENCPK